MVYLSLFRNIFPVNPFACILGLLTLSLPLLPLEPESSFDLVDLFEEGEATELEEIPRKTGVSPFDWLPFVG